MAVVGGGSAIREQHAAIRLSCLAALVALVGCGSQTGKPAPAVATTPQAVTITVGITPTDSGPWSATGAIVDSGTYHRSDVQLTASGSRPSAGDSIHETDTFTGSGRSTFTIRVQGLFALTSAGDCCDLSGQWTAAGGTGKYAGLQGQGTFTRAGDTVV
jgi:hypothetical protein